MRIYARPSAMLARQLFADGFVIAWGIAWWLVGRAVDAVIRGIAGPSRSIAEQADQMRRAMSGAAGEVGSWPWVGGTARTPFDEMAKQIEAIGASAHDQVAAIELAATVTGWLVFLIPLLSVVVFWLPWRARFVRRSGETLALAEQEGGSDLLALRALATQPLRQLTAITDDPVAAWREGDADAIGRLADLELARAGVRRRPGRVRARATDPS